MNTITPKNSLKTETTEKFIKKSTLWSKFWSAVGLLALLVGLVSGASTIVFLVSSVPATVTVLEVTTTGLGRKQSYGFVLEAFDEHGNLVIHEPNIIVGQPLHSTGEIVAGRVSQSSGRVLSDAILAIYKWHGIMLTLIGLYLSRRVTLSPIAYFVGRLVGLSRKLLQRLTKPL